MTPKQKYDERKRLRNERLLAYEQRASERRLSDDEAEKIMRGLLTSFERIADVLELWADTQPASHVAAQDAAE